jgi:hypothetical protein
MPKTFMGVVHLRALPSAGGAGFEPVLEAALADAKALVEGGVDAVMVENFGDAPFHRGGRDDPVPPDVPAALAVVAREVRARHGVPVAINCLRNDAVAALGAAAIAGAAWVRVNVLAGSYVTDQGVVDGEAARVRDYRRQLRWDGGILADLLVKHAAPLAPVVPGDAARDLAERSGADAIVLSGARTGAAVDEGFVAEVRAAVPGFPLWIGSGIRPDNAARLWALADGVIVGTALKHGGRVGATVDPARVRELRRAMN